MRLSLTITRTGTECPFANDTVDLRPAPGQCLWLRGASGSGKTSLIEALLGLRAPRGFAFDDAFLARADDLRPRMGILFQSGGLLDQLSVGDNLALSLRAAGRPHDADSVAAELRGVGLENCAGHMRGELSGGMLRRAALAQILAQGKDLIVLDEPFVGLDDDAVEDVIAALDELRARGIAFILISHRADLAARIATPELTRELHLPAIEDAPPAARTPQWGLWRRTRARLREYGLGGLPLIICAFLAAGLAIGALFAGMLREADVATLIERYGLLEGPIGGLLEGHIKRQAAYYGGYVRRHVYAEGVARMFIIEMGPLLTALLLTGHIGAAYAGEVATMQSTRENHLLRTLGLGPRAWALRPAALAALATAPVLSVVGTLTALTAAMPGAMAGRRGIYTRAGRYWADIAEAATRADHWWQQPWLIHGYRIVAFTVAIFVVAEWVARRRPDLQPREVRHAITWTVVLASLAIIVLDGVFSLWV